MSLVDNGLVYGVLTSVRGGVLFNVNAVGLTGVGEPGFTSFYGL